MVMPGHAIMRGSANIMLMAGRIITPAAEAVDSPHSRHRPRPLETWSAQRAKHWTQRRVSGRVSSASTTMAIRSGSGTTTSSSWSWNCGWPARCESGRAVYAASSPCLGGRLRGGHSLAARNPVTAPFSLCRPLPAIPVSPWRSPVYRLKTRRSPLTCGQSGLIRGNLHMEPEEDEQSNTKRRNKARNFAHR
jgi:hypothetical protein